MRTMNHRVEVRSRDREHPQSCVATDGCPGLADYDLAYEYNSRFGGVKTNRTPACRVHAMEWARLKNAPMPASRRSEVPVA